MAGRRRHRRHDGDPPEWSYYYGPPPGVPHRRTPPEDKPGPGLRAFYAIEDGAVAGWKTAVWCWRHRLELTPAVYSAAVFLAAVELHHKHHISYTTLGLLLGEGLGLRFANRWQDGPKLTVRLQNGRELEIPRDVLYARAVVTATCLWLLVAVVAGPTTHWVDVALACMALPLSWPWLHHRLPRRKGKNPVLDHWRARWWEIRDLPNLRQNLYGTDVVDASGDMDYPELTIELPYGHGKKKNIVEVRAEIEDAFGLDEGTVRVEPLKTARLVKVVIRQPAALETKFDWSAQELPTSARQPLILGRSERGALVRAVLAGTHTFLIGMTQWGKSNELNALLWGLTACRDVLVCTVDLKGGAFALPWARRTLWSATTMHEALLLQEDINRWIDARGAAYAHDKAVIGTPAVPYIFVVFDEFAEGVGSAGNSQLQRGWESIIRRGAGVGIFAIEATQEGSHDSTGNEKIRGNHSNYLAFHGANASAGRYGLDNYSRLDVSKIEHKGAFYYHSERGDYEDLIRGPLILARRSEGPADLYVEEIALAHEQYAPTLDPITVGASRHFAGRWHRQTEQFRQAAGIHLLQTPPQSPAHAYDLRQEPSPMPYTNQAPGPLDRARMAQEEAEAAGANVTVQDLAQMRSRGNVSAMLARSVNGKMDQLAYDLVHAGSQGAAPKDLYRSEEGTPRLARSTVHDKLRLLMDAGLVERLPADAGYRAVDWQNPVDAFDAIKNELRRPPVPA